MKVRTIDTIVSGTSFSEQDLLSYLSQVVLTMIDEETKKKHMILKGTKQEIFDLQKNLEKEKDQVGFLSSELSKQKALSRVLDVIGTLKREGVMVGQNKAKVYKKLLELDNMNYHELRNLEERLAVQLPEKYNTNY